MGNGMIVDRPPQETPGPAPMPAPAKPAPHLTPTYLYTLGFRGYEVKGVELILPPICYVPSGVFEMGGDKTRIPHAFDKETTPFPVQVDAFYIAQHPVTVAEYACAVRANALGEPSEGIAFSTTWAQQLAHPEYPVTCVSSRGATTYAHWLAKTTGQPWRLPSEAEWEKAARWDAQGNGERGVSRRYPWGDEFDATRCNTLESGIGTVMPVGSYATGASPCGAQDMAGNVKEWTSSTYKPYPTGNRNSYDDANSSGRRVFRGGSYCLDSLSARTTYRNYYDLDDIHLREINDDLGFRLALVSPGA
ncbi:MAG: SUMF1/EgtB/PvdO family nonheme iron enzyme [Ktedonobacterales bacterium]